MASGTEDPAAASVSVVSAADPFPDSRPFSGLLAEPMTVSFPPVPEGASGWRMTGLSDVVLLARMPDGNCALGCGATDAEAMAGARRNWRKWKRANAGPLAVDGREYQRRLRARRRRRSGRIRSRAPRAGSQ
jgi:hypothetical protein